MSAFSAPPSTSSQLEQAEEKFPDFSAACSSVADVCPMFQEDVATDERGRILAPLYSASAQSSPPVRPPVSDDDARRVLVDTISAASAPSSMSLPRSQPTSSEAMAMLRLLSSALAASGIPPCSVGSSVAPSALSVPSVSALRAEPAGVSLSPKARGEAAWALGSRSLFPLDTVRQATGSASVHSEVELDPFGRTKGVDYHALGDKRRQETSAFVSDYSSAGWPSGRPKDVDCRVPGVGFDAQNVLSSAISRGASGAQSHTPVQSMGDPVRQGRTGYISDTFPLSADEGSVYDLYQCNRSSTRARENRGAYGIQAKGPSPYRYRSTV